MACRGGVLSIWLEVLVRERRRRGGRGDHDERVVGGGVAGVAAGGELLVGLVEQARLDQHAHQRRHLRIERRRLGVGIAHGNLRGGAGRGYVDRDGGRQR